MSVVDFVYTLVIVVAALAALAISGGIWELYDRHRDIARRARSRRHGDL